MKIMTTALFSVLMLGRRLTLLQWASLCLLACGVCLVQMPDNTETLTSSGGDAFYCVSISEQKHFSAEPISGALYGFAVVLCACALSGFACVWFELMLKRQNEVGIWVRNVQVHERLLCSEQLKRALYSCLSVPCRSPFCCSLSVKALSCQQFWRASTRSYG